MSLFFLFCSISVLIPERLQIVKCYLGRNIHFIIFSPMFSQTLLHQGSLALSHELSPLSAVLKLAHDISSVLLWVIWGSPVLKAVKNLVDPSHFLPHIVSCSHLLIFRVLRDNLSPSFDINVVLGLGIFTCSVCFYGRDSNATNATTVIF